MLVGKKILLGITGGIAAYKAADLVRRLQDTGAKVQVVMTEGAKAFITPLTLQALSGHPVHDSLFTPKANNGMDHISLADWPDLLLIAPTTADFIAKMVQCHANDLLSTLCLVTRTPIAIAPSMNENMWSHVGVERNIAELQARGVNIWGPDSGSQACGVVGPGRMLEPSTLVNHVNSFLQQPLKGKKILITAGPTREPIDAVRYITNYSSGKMGFALAKAASILGAQVTLVTGPVNLTLNNGSIDRIDIETAEQMSEEVMERIHSQDIFIAAAAVGDFRVAEVSPRKLPKGSIASLSLIENPDIVGSVALMDSNSRPFVVGFAAQTESLRENANRKLDKKRLDMVAANLVGPDLETGFDCDENELLVLWNGGERQLPRMKKTELAFELLNLINQCKEKTDETKFLSTQDIG